VAAALAAGALVCGAAAPAHATPGSVTVAILPPDTTVSQLAEAGFSVGVMSAGIGAVPAEQTYLDVSQGNRIASSFYDGRLPTVSVGGPRAPEWKRIVERADGAPADVMPGLLGSSLSNGELGARADPSLIAPALMAVDRRGMVARGSVGPGLTVTDSFLRRTASRLPANDLLIAFAMPTDSRVLPIGIAGPGFAGNLTSDSTRTEGYVLSTDIAPTILRRFALPIPEEMNGEPIRTEGKVDPAAVEELAERMEVIPNRRAPVVILCLVAWILAAAIAGLARADLRRSAMAWLALVFAYMPLMLLAGAALEPGAVVEGLLVGFGAAVLAALTLSFLRGWWALATACAITVTAYAIDVVAGSDLTRLSLLGPNPIYGVRFYGIGNELEALIAVMVPVAVGAGLSAYGGWGRGVSRAAAVAAFFSAAVVGAIVFGAGRFGADVGAAIVLPVGAAVASALLHALDREHFPGDRPGKSSRSSRGVLLAAAILATPFIALVLLVLIDLVSGGNAHLTRSVLDAGGTGDLGEVAQRRLELSAHDFGQAAGNPLFWIVVLGIGLAVAKWRRIDAWLRPAPLARAGLLGACAAVAVGVLVNDSGASFLTLGALALGAAVAFAWSQAGRAQ
jgi:hypothetical protein